MYGVDPPLTGDPELDRLLIVRPDGPRASELGPPLTPWIAGQADGGGGALIPCVDPATGEPFAQVATATADDVDRAVDAAGLAAALWRKTPFADRRVHLHRLADVLRDEAWTIAHALALELGRPAVETLALEVLPALDHVRYVADHAHDALAGEAVWPRRPMHAHKTAYYLFEPVGLVAIVTPFSAPFALPMAQTAAALAMGNAVLLRPSEHAVLAGLRVGECVARAGFPDGVVNVLPTVREDALFVVTHPRVDKIFVTGTLETGREILARAGCVPRPVVLALGGKHASVVASDADLERAARGVVWGALAASGQHPAAIERVYVEEPVAHRFVDLVLARVDELRTGNPREQRVELGPLISDAHRRRVEAQVGEALARGAKLLRGGQVPAGPGFFYPPTVVLAPPEDSALMREVTLGPVIPIVVVDSLERAVLLANDRPSNPWASGWTRSPETAARLLESLEADVVTVNDVLYDFGEPAATRGFHGLAGMGEHGGITGLREMCRRRFVVHDPFEAQAPLHAHPYDREAERAAGALLARLHARGPLARLRGLAGLAASARFRARVPRRFFFLRSRSTRG